jgi:hypothetical protein
MRAPAFSLKCLEWICSISPERRQSEKPVIMRTVYKLGEDSLAVTKKKKKHEHEKRTIRKTKKSTTTLTKKEDQRERRPFQLLQQEMITINENT